MSHRPEPRLDQPEEPTGYACDRCGQAGNLGAWPHQHNGVRATVCDGCDDDLTGPAFGPDAADPITEWYVDYENRIELEMEVSAYCAEVAPARWAGPTGPEGISAPAVKVARMLYDGAPPAGASRELWHLWAALTVETAGSLARHGVPFQPFLATVNSVR